MCPAPRILFLTSEAPHSGAAGSIYFHRLFADWPADRLHVVTNHPPPEGADTLACAYRTLRLPIDRLDRTRLWPWKARLRVLGAGRLVPLRPVERAVGDFRPQAVATLMQDSWYYDLAARYAAARRLPLILFVHDLADGFEPVPGRLRARQRAKDRGVYRRAALRLCVSPGMVSHFEREFEAPGHVLPPPRSETPPSQDPENCRTLKNPSRLTLGYAGGLHYGYGEQLLRMIPALRAAGAFVEVFGATPSGPLAPLLAASDVFRFNGHAATPEHAWRGLLARCDATLLPYLYPPDQHARQYRTHFPSKLGDALSLGLPLLVTGPADASGAAWCRARPGSALTVEQPDELAASLRRLRDSADLRVSLSREGRAAAAAFDPAPLRARLQGLLREVVPLAPT